MPDEPNQPLDRIHIRDLVFRCIIGVHPEERRDKQDVVVNLTLFADLSKAGLTDRIEDTVDYSAIKKEIISMGEESQFMLIERLAEHIAQICLSYGQVQRVRVLVEKPAALRFARTVGVEIERSRTS